MSPIAATINSTNSTVTTAASGSKSQAEELQGGMRVFFDGGDDG